MDRPERIYTEEGVQNGVDFFVTAIAQAVFFNTSATLDRVQEHVDEITRIGTERPDLLLKIPEMVMTAVDTARRELADAAREDRRCQAGVAGGEYALRKAFDVDYFGREYKALEAFRRNIDDAFPRRFQS